MKKASIILLFCLFGLLSFGANAQSNCTYSLNPTSLPIGAAGGNLTLNIITQSNCAWTVTVASSDQWVQIANASGVGNGIVNFTVIENLGPQRFANIYLNGEGRIAIFQNSGCRIVPSSSTLNFPANGGIQTITYQISSPDCGNPAILTDPWVEVSDLNGSYTIRVVSNSGAARNATVFSRFVFDGPSSPVLTVNQSSAPPSCTYTLNPTNLTVPHNGGNYSLNITTQEGCFWTAQYFSSSLRPVGLTFTSPTSGVGSGRVDFTISAALTMSNRSGTIFINSVPHFEIVQDHPCGGPFINPKNANVPKEGGQGSFNVVGGGSIDCVARVQSNDSWITATGSGGPAGGSATYTVAPNTGPARTGTISVTSFGSYNLPQGTELFTINQAGGCVYSINPTNVQIGSSLVFTTVNVTTSPGCTWTTVLNDSWLDTLAGGGGIGSGQATIIALQNPGAPRTGTATIAGQTFTVNQAGVDCTYSLSPSSVRITSTGGGASFGVTTPIGCTWTATSNAAWIMATSSGSGPGRVDYFAQANTGTAPRSGTITVGNQTFSIFQPAAAPQIDLITGSGRVVSNDGKSVRGALVTFTNQTTGEKQTVITNQFGYFHLTVQRGQNYGVGISHKRYKFTGTRFVSYFNSALSVIFAADAE